MDAKGTKDEGSSKHVHSLEISQLLNHILQDMTSDLSQWLDKTIENKKS